jgi:hypothetical protein
VKDISITVARKLTSSDHRLATENKLRALEIERLRASLATKNKRTSHGKALPLPMEEKSIGGATFFSPRSVRRAKAKLKQMEPEKKEHQAEVQKADKKKLKADTKLIEEKLAKEAAEARVKDKKKKEREKAERAAKAVEQKAIRENNARQKALQTTQNSKPKALKLLSKQPKRQKKVGGAVGSAVGSGVAHGATPALPPKQSRSGRNIKPPAQFR